MAGKRLAMAPSPGTGLFVHKPKSKGGYSREPLLQEAVPSGGKNLAEQEEERVNSRLVDILERKCAKLRTRAEEEEQRRHLAEDQLEELQGRLRERDKQVADLCSAQRDLAQDRQAAVQRGAALAGAQQECDLVQQTLRARDAEIKRLREKSTKSEEEWKTQILKLVTEAQQAGQRCASIEQELLAANSEQLRLTDAAQDVVQRYEDESARRLELEERCLGFEEKLKHREHRTRGESDSAQQKVKQSLQA
ncbi:unnamed protein product [Polarella glacialis]|uniref:Uncharacterized protein n=1 Tax=Polarella glacialis TaxID=89957 RepID=A0A813DW38_POLGL|nr:unnamed protein product [Polarella glacialis]